MNIMSANFNKPEPPDTPCPSIWIKSEIIDSFIAGFPESTGQIDLTAEVQIPTLAESEPISSWFNAYQEFLASLAEKRRRPNELVPLPSGRKVAHFNPTEISPSPTPKLMKAYVKINSKPEWYNTNPKDPKKPFYKFGKAPLQPSTPVTPLPTVHVDIPGKGPGKENIPPGGKRPKDIDNVSLPKFGPLTTTSLNVRVGKPR
ncbi:hypothetical protein N7495_005048 [Penicillium taxi]|uniref:uncharacterized protein n=1 Tax=Penicillium taxi TaxID=168475 RepID=UPI0025450217|nr:uncharacterized protein N7495_005048 [Penicillium taxi]KAJ5893357.1 hypothetical protein N7495_005048 [Penicillium taxi]